MSRIKELIGKVWMLDNTESMLCFEQENLLLFCKNDHYEEINFEQTDNALTITSPDEYRGEYSFTFCDNKLTINANVTTPLVGLWNIAATKNIQPLEVVETIDVESNSDNCNWMNYIESSRSLKDMCIPATHDSAAYKMEKGFFAPWTLTQRANFEQQLNDGIRAFDLRLSENMNFFHGSFYLCQNIYDCLDVMKNFLNYHPSETIIVTVKPENCDNMGRFVENFKQVLNRYSEYFYTGSYIPTLGEVRKKIVLLRRFDFDKGINMQPWLDNTTFKVKDTNGLTIQIQDHYNASYEDKVKWLLQDFCNARDNHSMMYITHFSLQSNFNDLINVANTVQNKFIDSRVWADMSNRRYIGIYPFDFYNITLIPFFICTNYK